MPRYEEYVQLRQAFEREQVGTKGVLQVAPGTIQNPLGSRDASVSDSFITHTERLRSGSES